MKKIPIDIKNGKFTIYPSGEELSSLEGWVSHAYFRQVGNFKQLKVVIINEETEYTLNSIPNNLAYESLVTELIGSEGKVNLILEEYFNAERTYYLVKNINK